MKLSYLTSAVLLLMVFFSCTKESNFSDELVVSNARGTGSSDRLTVVRLKVKVEANNGISYDVDRQYVNGQENVSAVLRDSDGQFFFISNTTFKTPQRRLTFPFNPGINGKSDYRMVTSFPAPLQKMTAGQELTGGMRVWAYESKSSSEVFAMRYRYGIQSPPDPATSEVKVTFNGTSWTLEPIPQPNTGTVDANFRIGTEDWRLQPNVPFKIILERI